MFKTKLQDEREIKDCQISLDLAHNKIEKLVVELKDAKSLRMKLYSHYIKTSNICKHPDGVVRKEHKFVIEYPYECCSGCGIDKVVYLGTKVIES
jgi:hypothetical protein